MSFSHANSVQSREMNMLQSKHVSGSRVTPVSLKLRGRLSFVHACVRSFISPYAFGCPSHSLVHGDSQIEYMIIFWAIFSDENESILHTHARARVHNVPTARLVYAAVCYNENRIQYKYRIWRVKACLTFVLIWSNNETCCARYMAYSNDTHTYGVITFDFC